MKYLSHPLKGDFKITEGWIYSKAERSIHQNYFHHGIDYETPYATPVYACADGIAVASYHRFPLNDKLGFPILYKNKPVSNGLGLFVQIFHSEDISGVKGGTITQYGHLSGLANDNLHKRTPTVAYDISSRVLRRNNRKRKNKLSVEELEVKLHKLELLEKRFPWIKTIYGYNFNNDIDKKESYLYTPKELNQHLKQNSPHVMKVKKGELIGYTGTSSVFYGTQPYNEDTFIKIPQFDNTWDEVHLHFEIAQRDWETGAKINQLDPYNIYKTYKWYGSKKSNSIFIEDK